MTYASNVTINPYPVATGTVDQTNWYRNAAGWKMMYNEMVEFWGSLIELARYKVSGELPERVTGKSMLATRLKELLLFKIDNSSLRG